MISYLVSSEILLHIYFRVQNMSIYQQNINKTEKPYLPKHFPHIKIQQQGTIKIDAENFVLELRVYLQTEGYRCIIKHSFDLLS